MNRIFNATGRSACCCSCLRRTTEADLNVCYEVNVEGTFFGAKAAIRRMPTLCRYSV